MYMGKYFSKWPTKYRYKHSVNLQEKTLIIDHRFANLPMFPANFFLYAAASIFAWYDFNQALEYNVDT